MSALDPVVYRGSYIPFPKATPAITVNPQSSPDASLCWADAWTPVILTCLKTLTRPETWAGSDLDIAEAMTWAEDLIGSITDGCGGGSFPFTCIADFTTSANPFGTWSIWSGCPIGDYVALSGYEPTIDHCGSPGYSGVHLEVILSSPLVPSDIAIEYDMTLGSSGEPTDYQSGVYDLANSAFIGTPVLFSGAGSIGHFVYHSGPSAAPTDHLMLFVRCARGIGSSLPVLPGTLVIRDAAISGTATSNPCA